jgi:hypothetical protein
MRPTDELCEALDAFDARLADVVACLAILISHQHDDEEEAAAE